MEDFSAEKYIECLEYIKKYNVDFKMLLQESDKVLQTIGKFAEVTSDTLFENVHMSARLFNLFKHSKFFDTNTTVRDLENLSIKQFLGWKNAGWRTLKELKEICFFAGIEMKP